RRAHGLVGGAVRGAGPARRRSPARSRPAWDRVRAGSASARAIQGLTELPAGHCDTRPTILACQSGEPRRRERGSVRVFAVLRLAPRLLLLRVLVNFAPRAGDALRGSGGEYARTS